MTGSGTSDTSGLGGGLALLAIAGVALGGTSIFGGVGSVWRTVLGVLILGMITNGFDLLAVPDYWQNIVRGILIIFAVAISTMIERRLAADLLFRVELRPVRLPQLLAAVQDARRWTSQTVAAMSSTDSASSQPPSIHWNGQNRLAGW